MSHVRIFQQIHFFALGILCNFAIAHSALAQIHSFHPAEGKEAKWQSTILSTSPSPVASEKDATFTNPQSLEFHFVLPQLETSPLVDGYTEITTAGLTPIGGKGKPALATTGSLLLVPQGFRAEVQVLKNEEAVLNETLVVPHQEKFRCDCPEGKRFDFDAALYSSAEVFPAEVARLEEVGFVQNLHLVRLAIYPLRQNPKGRSLIVSHDLVLKVNFVPEWSENVLSGASVSAPIYQLALSMVANSQGLGVSSLPQFVSEVMLIVVADELKDSLQSFVSWKRAKGIQVEVIPYSEAGGNREALKNYLQKYYDTHELKPSYLLLVGNKKTMPPFIENTTTGGSPQRAASDYPFSLLTGNDALPDILYGRLLADTAEDVEVQTSRWIEYEKNPTAGDWFNKALMIASNEKQEGPSDREYVEMMGANLQRFTYKKVDYLLEGEKTATRQNIWDVLNEGRSWITYLGHGTGLSWASTNEDFGNEEVLKLKSTRLPVLIDVACSNANYIKYEKPFGRTWVSHHSGKNNYGAVAYYGGSVNISWDPPAIMATGISQYHFEKPTHSLGATVLAGQLYLIEKKGLNEESKDNLRWYQLLGDPSLMMRTDIPKVLKSTLSIDHIGQNALLNVKVKDSDGTPLPGILASVGSSLDPLKTSVGLTDARGEITLSLGKLVDGKRRRSSTVTLTGYNTETQSTALEVR